jgi:hypothetical protein
MVEVPKARASWQNDGSEAGRCPGLPVRQSVLQFAPARGAVAQLGERLVRNEKVSGSIPLGSTIHLFAWLLLIYAHLRCNSISS